MSYVFKSVVGPHMLEWQGIPWWEWKWEGVSWDCHGDSMGVLREC